jgi:hypothetical protein
VYPKIIRISIFIREDVIKKELNGLIIKRIISTIDTKEHRHTFLVTSVEEFISILYILLEKYKYTFYVKLMKRYSKNTYTYIVFLKVYI